MWIRIANSNACEWCQSLVGQAEYYENIDFRRHTNCRCIIINTEAKKAYGDGAKKGVWTEKENYNELLSKTKDKYLPWLGDTLPDMGTHKIIRMDKAIVKVQPSAGKILGEFNDHTKKINDTDRIAALWIINTFGGDITPIKSIKSRKTPDALWNSPLHQSRISIEFKDINGSNTSIANQIRKASKQIDDGVVLLNITTNNNSIKQIVKAVEHNMNRYDVDMVVIKQGDDLIEIINKK